ncbi:MAG: endonuclease Q family protein [Patescibacteria group bacterium]|nr:endonuclease Q family protein [Patescibacteria group bacterium]
MRQSLDLHIHSKYSRACSKSLELPLIAKTCETKGIDIVTTSDFTHPKWFAHMKDCLVEDTEGVYKLKTSPAGTASSQSTSPNRRGYDVASKTRFIVGTEIASIKKHKGKTRRIHLLIFAPSIEVAEKFNNKLNKMGFNLKSDGRPILGLTSKQILELMLETDERMMMIPAHAWTPWFGIFGSKGGYDSLQDAFEELTPYVRAVETGLSSDPLMNWRLSSLDNITLISNSDAHSNAKLGREANVFDFKSEKEITYTEIKRIIDEQDRKKFISTIEFFPEEGKYHYDGHMSCNFSCAPEETKKLKGLCPKCGKKLIIGVENRVHELADRSIEEARDAGKRKIPYQSIVPLVEILADVFACGVNTKKVSDVYEKLLQNFHNEFFILLEADLSQIAKVTSKDIAEAISRVRSGNIFVKPGFDGVFGVVKVFKNR